LAKWAFKLEHLDGNNSLNEASEDEKYSSIKYFLKNGWLGSTYQTFIDAMEVIDAFDLQEDVGEIEKTKVLEARKCGLGLNFQGLPPLNSSLHKGIQILSLFWSIEKKIIFYLYLC
jgi:hypothetical protein